MVAWLWEHRKKHCIAHFKWVNCMMCESSQWSCLFFFLIWVKKREPGEEHSSRREYQVQRPLRLEGVFVSVRKRKSRWWEFSEGETEDGRDLDLQRWARPCRALGAMLNIWDCIQIAMGGFWKNLTGEVITGLCFGTITVLSGKRIYKRAKV